MENFFGVMEKFTNFFFWKLNFVTSKIWPKFGEINSREVENQKDENSNENLEELVESYVEKFFV